jgi:hypothetical protein
MLVNNATYTTDPLPEYLEPFAGQNAVYFAGKRPGGGDGGQCSAPQYLEPVAGQNAVYAAGKMPRITLVGSPGDTYEYGAADGGGGGGGGAVYAVPFEAEAGAVNGAGAAGAAGGRGAIQVVQVYGDGGDAMNYGADAGAVNNASVVYAVPMEEVGDVGGGAAPMYVQPNSAGDLYGEGPMYVQPNGVYHSTLTSDVEGGKRLQSHTQAEMSEYC